jgi:beta-lactam-binding protein with PASTA domain
VGQTQALATTAITGANLLVGTVTRQSEWIILPGVVVGQSPAAGSSAAVKSAVNLVVSSGSTCADMEIVKAAFGSKRGQPAYNPLADVNNDGVVNVLDLSMVARALPAGTVCN